MNDCQALSEPIIFECDGDRLVGVLHSTDDGERSKIGVLVVVGGPQYRVGSHRQFVVMARAFASAGFPVMRFDARGMGDSDGDHPGFDRVDSDTRSAIDAFMRSRRGLEGVVLWGLCDGASAALMYAPTDRRVVGVVAANTWARTTRGEARAYVEYYYSRRILQASFWKKALSGKVGIWRSLGEFFGAVRLANTAGERPNAATVPSFVDRMRVGLESFQRPVLFVESGRDLTAAEFATLRVDDVRWRAAFGQANVSIADVADADHTFSDSNDLRNVSARCIDWMRTLPAFSGHLSS